MPKRQAKGGKKPKKRDRMNERLVITSDPAEAFQRLLRAKKPKR